MKNLIGILDSVVDIDNLQKKATKEQVGDVEQIVEAKDVVEDGKDVFTENLLNSFDAPVKKTPYNGKYATNEELNNVKLKLENALVRVSNQAAAVASSLGGGFSKQGVIDIIAEVGGGGGSTLVLDNLTSTSTTAALSANQGKVLKDAQDLLVTLAGVGATANLGTFTGTTITDNASIKSAFQEVETALEAIDGIYVASGTVTGTDLILTMSDASTVTIDVTSLISTSKQTVVADETARDALNAAAETGDLAYVVDASADATVTAGAALYVWDGAAWQKIAEFESLDFNIDDLADLRTLTGTTAGDTTFGSFSFLTDNTDLNTLLGEIDLGLEFGAYRFDGTAGASFDFDAAPINSYGYTNTYLSSLTFSNTPMDMTDKNLIVRWTPLGSSTATAGTMEYLIYDTGTQESFKFIRSRQGSVWGAYKEIGVADNLYSANGTLTSNRTVDGDSRTYSLNLANLSNFIVSSGDTSVSTNTFTMGNTYQHTVENAAADTRIENSISTTQYTIAAQDDNAGTEQAFKVTQTDIQLDLDTADLKINGQSGNAGDVITSSGAGAAPVWGKAVHTETFDATTDWGTAAGGLYTITVAAATHGITTPTTVQVWEDVAGDFVLVTPDSLKIKANGDIEISVPEVPELRFAGRVVIR